MIRRVDDCVHPSGAHRPMWWCRCSCGNERAFLASNLLRGTSLSCGCLQKELLSKRKLTHGGYANKEKLYSVWLGMRKRCCCETESHFKYYGACGIKVCAEWVNDYSVFRTWSLENGYREGLSIDRIDVNGDYSPQNCRWATATVQQNNRRTCINLTYNGETHTLKEWSRIRNIKYPTLYQRYHLRWSVERMLRYNQN